MLSMGELDNDVEQFTFSPPPSPNTVVWTNHRFPQTRAHELD